MVLILIHPERSLFSHTELILLLAVCVTAMRPCWLCLPLPTLQHLHLPACDPGDHSSPPGLPKSAHSIGFHFSPLGSPQAFPSLACACPRPQGAGAAAVPSSCPAAGQGGTGSQILLSCSWPWAAGATQCPENVLLGVTGNTGGFHLQIHRNYMSRSRKQMPTLRHFVISLSQLYPMKSGICNSIL